MAEHLQQQGNIVRLVCKSSKKALRIAKGNVDGMGGLGEFARFIVHARSPGVIALQNYKEQENYLAIRDNKLVGKGKGGPFCDFKVVASNLGQGMISLESVKNPNHYVGILPNGFSKPPSNTRTGPHGSFSVELVQSAVPKGVPGHPLAQQPAYPPAQQPAYPPAQQPAYYPPAQQPAYPPAQQPAYPPAQQPVYPPAQQPAYPPAQQPAYPPVQQPGYQVVVNYTPQPGAGGSTQHPPPAQGTAYPLPPYQPPPGHNPQY